MTGREFGVLIAITVMELISLFVFLWFFMKKDWALAVPVLIVFGAFRWLFKCRADHIRRRYDI